ncbi:protein DOG1-like 1 [Lycium barbarum]|uniref:protein DOG1-like 1 n=1 Tax=Lycium barbarum TaxID=112863 RepID=UPI00293F5055|nr:protein DOG1-like 1 [Lycium barbarum]
MANSKNIDRKEQEYLHCSWMSLQHEELTELEHAVAQAKNGLKDEHELRQLIQKIVNHFQDYTNNRTLLARNDVSPFFAPATCTTLENSVLWIAGCRPSSFIRFTYALSGMDVESHIIDFLEGKRIGGHLGELTGKQMSMIDELHGKTIREERKLSTKLASLQEDIVDQPLVEKMKKKGGGENDDEYENADEALEEHSQLMAGVMEEADELRMKTLKEIVNILEPVQAVEYLAAAKRIRFCVQQWGKKRDHEHSD